MPDIRIVVKNKIASGSGAIVQDNSDYNIIFSFDEEWAEYTTKTMRVQIGTAYIDTVFEGDTVPLPRINGVTAFSIGVFAGDLHTTTPATILCRESILTKGGSPAAPPEDVYAQIMAKLNSLDAGGMVGSVNGIQPDENGNVQIEVGGKQVQPDWNQNDDTQPDYVKNRTHWVEMVTSTIVDEVSPTYLGTEDGMETFILPEAYTLMVGGEYTVNWNGTEYTGVCQEADNTCVLGDFGLVTGGDSTGEPFLIGFFSAEAAAETGVGVIIYAVDGSTSLTLSIIGETEVVHQLPEKFIPERQDSYTIELALSDFTINDSGAIVSNNSYDDFAEYLLNGQNVWIDLQAINGIPERLLVVGWHYTEGMGLFLYTLSTSGDSEAPTINVVTLLYPNGTIPLG